MGALPDPDGGAHEPPGAADETVRDLQAPVSGGQTSPTAVPDPTGTAPFITLSTSSVLTTGSAHPTNYPCRPCTLCSCSRRCYLQHPNHTHYLQKDVPVYPGGDPREFWQRAEDRNRATAVHFDTLGLQEYEAMEAFVLWNGKTLL